MRSLAAFTLIASVALWSTACSECEFSIDCGPGMDCVDHECRDRPAPPILPPPPARPDSGVRDAGSRDAASSTVTPDGGDLDGGDVDGGRDAGLRDAGLRDAGFVDTPIPGARGMIWIREQTVAAGQIVHVIEARLVDESPATYQETTASYLDMDNRTCTLVQRRLTAGMPTPFLASAIRIELGGSHAPFDLVPDGGGRYVVAPGTNLRTRLFEGTSMPKLSIISSMAGDSPFTMQPITIPIPDETIATAPAAGSSVNLINLLGWQFGGDPVTVEVSDANREVVLSCNPIDDGGYPVPFDARQGYLNASRTDPQIVEIRRDAQTTGRAEVPGRGYIPITVRTSWGPRFTLVP